MPAPFLLLLLLFLRLSANLASSLPIADGADDAPPALTTPAPAAPAPRTVTATTIITITEFVSDGIVLSSSIPLPLPLPPSSAYTWTATTLATASATTIYDPSSAFLSTTTTNNTTLGTSTHTPTTNWNTTVTPTSTKSVDPLISRIPTLSGRLGNATIVTGTVPGRNGTTSTTCEHEMEHLVPTVLAGPGSTVVSSSTLVSSTVARGPPIVPTQPVESGGISASSSLVQPSSTKPLTSASRSASANPPSPPSSSSNPPSPSNTSLRPGFQWPTPTRPRLPLASTATPPALSSSAEPIPSNPPSNTEKEPEERTTSQVLVTAQYMDPPSGPEWRSTPLPENPGMWAGPVVGKRSANRTRVARAGVVARWWFEAVG
ncbi:hypothetical protein BDV95DRAFT_602347 [Massariosphaeria phaeospora]|uniref:Uncharacterized protein n=1 Tax=Massariosphaeria phaeospora TaxID=100035 RepID=A0A7C8MEM9_9PLEO|nr:hypothetical protein BDV95DRAFT_602347 [Massariosphaeria phaeospora]